MALVFGDRIRESTTTSGIGTLTLQGAEPTFQTFVDGIGDANECFYALVAGSGTDWEVGRGTVNDATPDTFSRDTVLASSNSNALIDLPSGFSHALFAVNPASRIATEVLNDQDNTIANADDSTLIFALGAGSAAEQNVEIRFLNAAGTRIWSILKQGSNNRLIVRDDLNNRTPIELVPGSTNETGLVVNDQDVGIGTTGVDATAKFEIVSTTKGMIPPRMTEAQKDAINSGTFTVGLLVYNTDTGLIEYYDGTSFDAHFDNDQNILANQVFN
jgi:hypothetical protein